MKSGRGGTNNPTLTRFLAELVKVQADPRSLVLVTGGYLELMIETVVGAKCKNPARYSYALKLLVLNEMNILSDEGYARLGWFRDLRNRAAHEPFFELTPDEAEKLRGYCMELLPEGAARDRVIDRLPLQAFCAVLVPNVWNEFREVLEPAFRIAPDS